MVLTDIGIKTTYSTIQKWTFSYHFFSEKFFFKTKESRILLFLVEPYPVKTDIIRYHLVPNFTALKLWNEKYGYVSKFADCSWGRPKGSLFNRYDNNIYQLIGLIARVFTNGPRDLGSIPGRVIRKTLKMVLDTSLLKSQ